jgi:hypothetical protein
VFRMVLSMTTTRRLRQSTRSIRRRRGRPSGQRESACPPVAGRAAAGLTAAGPEGCAAGTGVLGVLLIGISLQLLAYVR